MPVSKPLLIFDGDCAFCRSSVDYWRKLTGESVDYVPFQKAAPEFPEIPLERFHRSVVLVEPSGEVSLAAEAVFRLRALVPGFGGRLWFYEHAPGFRFLSEKTYRVIAADRPFADKMRVLLWGRSIEPASHFLTRWVFLRLLGIVYLAAFGSIWPQVRGLIGENGILPAAAFLNSVARTLGPERYHLLPTLAWLGAGDGSLEFLAIAGTFLSVLLILGVAEGPVLLVLWALYLSLMNVGQNFLSFQWDALLLEAGFLAIFLAPWNRLGGRRRRAQGEARRPPSRLVIWLLRWLLFRLLFLSGCVKLLSHDRAWRSLTALDYHYVTQPLPTPFAWYAFQLPHWFQKISTAGVFAFELGIPFLIFFPRRIRLIGCGLIVLFQLMIAFTGNYAFFNLLTIALALLLLDDPFLRRVLPRMVTGRSLFSVARLKRSAARTAGLAALAIVILFGSTVLFLATLIGGRKIPRAAMEVTGQWLEPFHIVSSYGLFAVMTTARIEIIIQGSNDGQHWLDYEFKYKPEDLWRRPRWVAPYQPRLDWQMWFAALMDFRDGQWNPWFENLLTRLLQGSPQVLGLLGKNPFPNAPPLYVRAVAYHYTFTDFAERRRTSDWWKRSDEVEYFPVASLRAAH
ncbi:MAG: lipase maturation factor family protein [Terriglobia bacterium]